MAEPFPPPDPSGTPAGSDPGAAGPSGDDAWRLPRHLGLAAVAVVVVLVAGGRLLNWWGPLNPRVSGWASTSITGASSEIEATVHLTNRSRTDLTVTGAHLTSSAPTGAETADELTAVRSVPVQVDDPCGGARFPWDLCSGSGWGASWSTLEEDGSMLPTTVVSGETIALLVTITAPPCGPDGLREPGWDQVSVDVRSAWGHETTRTFSISQLSGATLACQQHHQELPPETSAPADRAVAVAEIGDAFTTAYDASLDRPTREARVDDPRGLEEAGAEAMAGPFGDQVAVVRPIVDEVSFDRPGHATVRYRLGSPNVDPRVGEAVLVDGMWKVTRSTICADLSLASATCPPLPR